MLRNQNQNSVIIQRHEDDRLKTFKNIGVWKEKKNISQIHDQIRRRIYYEIVKFPSFF